MKRSRSRPSKSSQPPGPPDPAQDGLSAEEQHLWHHVARSIAPIKSKSRVSPPNTSGDGPSLEMPPPRRPARYNDPAAKTKLPHSTAPVMSSAAAPAPPPPLAGFDPRQAKRLGSGRAGIDARLDLHGLRHDDAQARLRAFLLDCHARGHKMVLVITGKGRETSDSTTPFAGTLDRAPRGVLRRNLPRWLDAPALREIVVSYTSAALRHGGDGAYYIQLRRRDR